jgi:hypothetical protein
MIQSGFLDASVSDDPHIGHTLTEGSVISSLHLGHLRMKTIRTDYSIERTVKQLTEVTRKAGFRRPASGFNHEDMPQGYSSDLSS